MKEGIAFTGVPSKEELEKAPGIPTKERLERGPVAIIECFQVIPCNPCTSACPFGAISMEEFPSLPRLNEEKCIGCGLCIPACPGLAIFVIDKTYSQTEALVSFPYEFLPVPDVGMEVDAVNRNGEVVTKGRVVKVKNDKRSDHTLIITISVPKEWAEDVRFISLNSVKR
ncbi:MAG: 4Fe-4S binding protein [Candidatus Bathyarchaeia archaeon]